MALERRGGSLDLLKKPGATLLLVGLALFFIGGPLLGAIPLIGSVIGTLSSVVGVLGIIAGGFLMVRSIRGPGNPL